MTVDYQLCALNRIADSLEKIANSPVYNEVEDIPGMDEHLLVDYTTKLLTITRKAISALFNAGQNITLICNSPERNSFEKAKQFRGIAASLGLSADQLTAQVRELIHGTETETGIGSQVSGNSPKGWWGQEGRGNSSSRGPQEMGQETHGCPQCSGEETC